MWTRRQLQWVIQLGYIDLDTKTSENICHLKLIVVQPTNYGLSHKTQIISRLLITSEFSGTYRIKVVSRKLNPQV